MTYTALRIAAALALVACAAQAAPILSDTFPTSSAGDNMFEGFDSSASPYCDPSDYACNQNVSSGNVNVGSTVNVVPVAQVTPVTQYQPIVQALAPIVDSACDYDFNVFGRGGGTYGAGSLSGALDGGIFESASAGDLYNNAFRFGMVGPNFAGSSLGMMGPSSLNRHQFARRNDLGFAGSEGSPTDSVFDHNASAMQPTGTVGETLPVLGANGAGIGAFSLDYQTPQMGPATPVGSTAPSGDMNILGGNGGPGVGFGMGIGGAMTGSAPLQQPQCTPNDIACQLSIPSQTVNMGSSTNITPSTSVLPSTVYQPQVQSLESNILASPAQDSSLPLQSVQLGSNTFIQPTTSVNPETIYQPSVSQLATDVQAAPMQDQSLPQSSVQLGSSVQIVPTVRVQPLTTFQNTIKSLPVIIQAEPCREIPYSGNSFTDGMGGFSAGVGISASAGDGLYGSSDLYGPTSDLSGIESVSPVSLHGSGSSGLGYGCM
ncbi:hypothetical protein EC991_000604 [Linnemannia zychae]|nr:hypothetical protein EC991_000604 [Linnemannia zychae]